MSLIILEPKSRYSKLNNPDIGSIDLTLFWYKFILEILVKLLRGARFVTALSNISMLVRL